MWSSCEMLNYTKHCKQCFLPTALFFLSVCFCVALFIAWVFVFVSLCSLLGCLFLHCFVHCLDVCFCVALSLAWVFILSLHCLGVCFCQFVHVWVFWVCFALFIAWVFVFVLLCSLIGHLFLCHFGHCLDVCLYFASLIAWVFALLVLVGSASFDDLPEVWSAQTTRQKARRPPEAGATTDCADQTRPFQTTVALAWPG